MNFPSLVSAFLLVLTNCILSSNLTGQYFNIMATEPNNSLKSIKRESNQSAVEIKFVGLHRQKPPHITLMFDITLRNHRSAPRWFILPYSLSPGFKYEKSGGVYGVSIFGFEGKGKVIVGRFHGTDNFQALLLPAGADIKLRNFPIEYWGEIPNDSLPLEVVTATNLTIGSQTARAWFGRDPTSDKRADVTQQQLQALGSRFTPDSHELPVLIVEESRLKLNICLTQNTSTMGT
ncbi:hypothetical protein [Dendronalium sp. ChiSLP03b]|uniref:hypothetical protein n=1 Tax=Dendronalium sp. ChiSLP03b TaxID=3075381 RepID=UPI002AD532F6|nr:hypothetical protein [Dendronalium sp. ChiSLP03b]MDZ8207684.1 hypothetical protein [Dendronalium sp. ChiSLP03b]